MARTKQTARRSKPVVEYKSDSENSSESEDPFAKRIESYYRAEIENNMREYQRLTAETKAKQPQQNEAEEKEKEKAKTEPVPQPKNLKRSRPEELSGAAEAKRPQKKARFDARSPAIATLRREITKSTLVIRHAFETAFKDQTPRHFDTKMDDCADAAQRLFDSYIDELIDDVKEHSSDDESFSADDGSKYNPRSPNF